MMINMETKFNFKSQICTSREQSEKLLTLGLKKETADCHWYYSDEKWKMGEGCNSIACKNLYPKHYIPAWSLHRLIEMVPTHIHRGEETFIREIRPISISYVPTTYDHHFFLFKEISNTYYDGIIATIEWLIKEGYFPKEYLV